MSQFNNNHSLVLGKLYFRHGPVSSAKTMNLLAVAYNYRLQGKKVLLLKVSPSCFSLNVLISNVLFTALSRYPLWC
jgi:thymidine kinase